MQKFKATTSLSVKNNFNKISQLYTQYKTPILFSGGSVAKAFAQMIVGFVIAKFVTPKDFGLWNTLNLALTYSLFVQAGLINGLNRELPYLFGKGEEKEATNMAGTVQTFTLISSVLVLLAGAGYIIFSDIKNPKVYYGIMGVTVLIVLNYYQSYLFSTFRSKNSFLNLSKLQFAHAFTNIVTLIFVFYYTYYGLVLKAITVSLIYVTLMHFTRPIKVGLLWNKEAFYKLIKVGLPIFALSYLEAIAGTTDKMLLLKYSNLENLGIYSFGFYALSSFSIFPSSIASYIYPKMTYNYGKTNDKLIMWKYAKKITLILLAVLTPIAILGYLICPILIERFFPAYLASAPIMQILLFAGVFSGSVIGVNALWSMKSWKYLITYQLIFCILLVGGPFIGLQLFENKLEGISYGLLIGHFINLFSGITFTYLATHKK
ncbi:MAG: oligosaccharide flippase family protein [Bacteroidia bacterium]